MKTIIITLLILITGLLNAQTVLLTEGFENLPLSFTSSGSSTWARSTVFHKTGAYSDTARINAAADSAILTSNTINATGMNYIILEFDHICKLELFDHGYVEYSLNNGTTWTKLTGSQYAGSGNFATLSNGFNSVSYPLDWYPSNNNMVPTNSWWKHESFDLSLVAANAAQLKIRFKLKDDNGTSNAGNFGWLLDNITIKGSSQELIPPTITLVTPLLQDTIYSTGPFKVSALINDTSGIDTAYVVFTANSITDTVGMELSQNLNYQYEGYIPSFNYNTHITYKVVAIDNTSNHNFNQYPNGGTKWFYTKLAPQIATIGTGSLTSTSVPIYNGSTAASGHYSDHVSIVTPSEMQGYYGNIDYIKIFKGDTAGYNLGNAKIQVYLKHTNLSTTPVTSPALLSELTGATLFFKDTLVSIQSGYSEMMFTPNQNNFMYNGQSNLMIIVRWYRPNQINTTIKWKYEGATGLASTFYGTSANPTTLISQNYRPLMDIRLTKSIYPYNVGVYNIDNPQSVILSNVATPVKVSLENEGSVLLNKATINWSVDGVAQVPHTWTGSLQQYYKTLPITIGSQTFSSGSHNIKVFTTLPNDSVDQDVLNDTMSMNFFACNSLISGSYTLGSPTADFANFQDLFDALNQCGIVGPTVINILPGVYDYQMTFTNSIQGIDSTNTLTFQSSTGNKDDVLIKFNATTSNWVVGINAMKYLTFKNLSFKSLSSGTGYVFNISNSSHHITIENCNITAPIGEYYYANPIYVSSGLNNYINILNNKITGGYYSVYISGTSAISLNFIRVNGNEVSEFNRDGIRLERINDLQVNNNYVHRSYNPDGFTLTSIRLSYCSDFVINANKCIMIPNLNSMGIYVEYSNGATLEKSLISNNISINLGTSTSTAFSAFQIGYSNYIDIVNNTFVTNSGSGNSEAAYFQGSATAGIGVHNNVFAHFGGAYAFEKTSGATIAEMSHNSYYTSGGVVMMWNGSGVNLSGGAAAIQTATLLDSFAVVGNPKLYAVDNGHSYSPSLNGAAKPFSSVTHDFDGDIRNSTTPDIGADEFDISSIDVGVLQILKPLAIDTQNRVVGVEAIIANFGSSAVTSMNLSYQVDNLTPVSTTWTGSIAPSTTDTITLSNLVIPYANHIIKVFTQLSGDTLTFNDTIQKNINGLASKDLSIIELVSPTDGCGKTANESIKIKIKNNGVYQVPSGFLAKYKVNGGITVVDTVNSSLAAGAEAVFEFSQKINMVAASTDSTYNILTWVELSSDPNQSNDSSNVPVISTALLPSPVVSDTTINYGSSAILSAIASNPIVWYANQSSNSPLYNGNPFTTPLLYDTTTYYAMANTNIPQQIAVVGNGSSTTGFWDPCIYGGGMSAGKYQILYSATDLIASGLSAGVIESIAFNADFAPSNLSGFDIYMGLTTQQSLTASFLTSGLSMVYDGALTGVTGWNTHVLQTPFYWDGASNLIIQICTQGNTAFAPAVYYTTTTYSSFLSLAGVGTSCSSPTGTSTYNRPNIKITTQATLGCWSAKVPVTVNVPLPEIDAKLAFIEPESGCGISNGPVKFGIVNMGTDTIPSGYSATYKINSGAYITPEIVTSSIPPSDTLLYVFSTLPALPFGTNGQFHNITGKLINANDSYSPNDTLLSEPILSYYTPSTPVVSGTTINYGSTASLTASASDTIYWYLDANATNLFGTGNPFVTPNLYDTTNLFVYSRKTKDTTSYILGTGTSLTGPTGASPYGSTQSGAKTQYLIRASELTALGMIEGYIQSIAFNNQQVKGSPLPNFKIKIGTTEKVDLSGNTFEKNLTTVYTSPNYIDVYQWNTHEFNTPFYWDGLSNIIIESYFQGGALGGFSQVAATATTYNSTALLIGGATLTEQDSVIGARFTHRPNLKIVQNGVGFCISDVVPITVNVINYPTVDAGLTTIFEATGSPSSVTGSPFKVVLGNYGLNNLTSAVIGWKDMNYVQTSFNWTGNLPSGQSDTVTIATSHIFKGGITTIKAWVNVTGDNFHNNDTTSANFNVCMNGTYTIKSLNGDFNSFTQAINSLETVGVCGPVTISADSLQYNEQLVIGMIPGSSSLNNIKFTSAQADSTKVIIISSTLQNTNYVIKIDGATNIIFDRITITANGFDYGNCIYLAQNSKDISVTNCILNSTNSTNSNALASAVASSVTGVSKVLIENNMINGGYKAVSFTGSSSAAKNKNIVVRNNKFANFNNQSASFSYADSVYFLQNEVIGPVTATTSYGVYMYYVTDYQISSNYFLLQPVSNAYGLYFNNSGGISTKKAIIDNNQIIIINAVQSTQGMYLSGNNYVKIVYNSMNIFSGNTGTRGLEISAGTNIDVLNNNLFSNFGRIVHLTAGNAISQCDYNNFNVNTTSTAEYIYWAGASCTTLAALKLADVNKNQHTINTIPLFTSTVDLHTQQIDLNGAGIPVSGFNYDFDGESRNTTTPDIGCDEFTPPAIDLGVFGVVYPTESRCGYSSSDSIVLKIKNFGTNDLNFASTPASITLNITGINPGNILHNLNSGILPHGHDTIIKVSNNYNLAMRGEYVFDAFTTISGDGNSTNNSMNQANIVSILPISNFPYFDDFENGYNASLVVNQGIYSRLTVDNLAASTGNAGLHLQGNYNGSGWISGSDITNAFNNNTSHKVKAYSCEIDATALTSLSMKFDLRQTMYTTLTNYDGNWFRAILYDSNGTMHYLKNDNGDSTFRPNSISADPFETHVFDLVQFLGQNIVISLEAVIKYNYDYGSFDGDNTYIDNFTLWAPTTTDATVYNVFTDKNYGQVGNLKTIKAVLGNYGNDTISSLPLALQVNGIIILRYTLITQLLPSEIDTFTFVTPLMLTSGYQTVCVFTELPTDSINYNDTACIIIKGLPLKTANYFDDFDGQDSWFAEGSYNQWELTEPQKANINSSYSGVNSWVTRESSNYLTNSIEYLYSPYIIIPANADTATLEFFHFMKVTTGGAFGTIEYTANNGLYWGSIGYIGDPTSVGWYNTVDNGQHAWNLNQNAWSIASIKLDPSVFNTGQPIQFRFKFRANTNQFTNEGWAIDNFRVFIPKYDQDASVIAVTSPGTSTQLGVNQTVKAIIKNVGNDTLTSMNMKYKLTGGVVITESWSGTLYPDSTTEFQFNQVFTPQSTNYDLCVWSNLATDQNHSNDSTCISITSTAGNRDAGVTAIVAPSGTIGINGSHSVTITIHNFGTDTLTSIPVQFQVGTTTIGNEVYSGTLLPGADVQYTFTTTFNSPLNSFTLCAKTVLTNDVFTGNDQNCVNLIGSSIGDYDGGQFAVGQNIPNPTSGTTMIEYFLPVAGIVTIEVSNIAGEVIMRMEEKGLSGENIITLDVTTLSPGIYFYRFENKGQFITRRMIVH